MTTTLQPRTSLTGGLDLGAHSVKVALLSHQGPKSTVLANAVIRISGCRDARAAMREGWGRVLADATLSPRDVDYIASTGAAAHSGGRVGHFYGQASQARGARLLFPDATAALDVGTNQIRCILWREPLPGRRAASRETGRPQDPRSRVARRTELHLVQLSPPFVDAGPPPYLAARAAMLLLSLAPDGKIVLTGGMVNDADFVHSLWSQLLASESHVSLLLSPDAVFAGAYGAAILAARRFERTSCSLAPVPIEPAGARLTDPAERSLN